MWRGKYPGTKGQDQECLHHSVFRLCRKYEVMMERGEVASHLMACGKPPIKCPDCSKDVERDQMARHKESGCMFCQSNLRSVVLIQNRTSYLNKQLSLPIILAMKTVLLFPVRKKPQGTHSKIWRVTPFPCELYFSKHLSYVRPIYAIFLVISDFNQYLIPYF